MRIHYLNLTPLTERLANASMGMWAEFMGKASAHTAQARNGGRWADVWADLGGFFTHKKVQRSHSE